MLPIVTQAELKLYLVERSGGTNCVIPIGGTDRNGRIRKTKNGPSYQVGSLPFKMCLPGYLALQRFVDEDLIPDQLGHWVGESSHAWISQGCPSVRSIRQTLDILENVDRNNQVYAPAIHCCSYSDVDQEILRAGYG